jgi:hypothetical protein
MANVEVRQTEEFGNWLRLCEMRRPKQELSPGFAVWNREI